MEQHEGSGYLIIDGAPEPTPVRYAYEIDRHNRVWRGTASRADVAEPLTPPAGPAYLETDAGARAPINYYHRTTPDGPVIVFTGRGAPPGE